MRVRYPGQNHLVRSWDTARGNPREKWNCTWGCWVMPPYSGFIIDPRVEN